MCDEKPHVLVAHLHRSRSVHPSHAALPSGPTFYDSRRGVLTVQLPSVSGYGLEKFSLLLKHDSIDPPGIQIFPITEPAFFCQEGKTKSPHRLVGVYRVVVKDQ